MCGCTDNQYFRLQQHPDTNHWQWKGLHNLRWPAAFGDGHVDASNRLYPDGVQVRAGDEFVGDPRG